jgi:hypothetical protein
MRVIHAWNSGVGRIGNATAEAPGVELFNPHMEITFCYLWIARFLDSLTSAMKSKRAKLARQARQKLMALSRKAPRAVILNCLPEDRQ